MPSRYPESLVYLRRFPHVIVNLCFSTSCKISNFGPFLQSSGNERSLRRPPRSPNLCDLQMHKNESISTMAINVTQWMYIWQYNGKWALTCEIEDLGPLLADVDTDVGSSYSQVGTTLVKHEGLHLQEQDTEMKTLQTGWNGWLMLPSTQGNQCKSCLSFLFDKTEHLFDG